MVQRFANLDDAVRDRIASSKPMLQRHLGDRLRGKTREAQQELVDAANRAFSPPDRLFDVFKLPEQE